MAGLAVIFLVSTSPKIYLFLTTGQTITKSDLIACLSEIARNDVINDKKPRTLSAPCRGQLKFQLLQKHTNINLNPRVVSWNWDTIFTVFFRNFAENQSYLSQLNFHCSQNRGLNHGIFLSLFKFFEWNTF